MQIFAINFVHVLILLFLLSSKVVFAQLPENEFYESGNKLVEWTQLVDANHLVRKEYFENGALKSQGFYRDQKLSGEYQEYFEDGSMYLQMSFLDGKQDGDYKEYYPGGLLKKKSFFKNGLMDGLYQEFSESSIPLFEYNFKDNLRHGSGFVYFPNGKLQAKLNFEFDQVNGDYEEYDEAGKLLLKGIMNNGKLVDENVDASLGSNQSSQPSAVFGNVKVPIIGESLNKAAAQVEKVSGQIKKDNPMIFYGALVFVVLVVLVGGFVYLNSAMPPENPMNKLKSTTVAAVLESKKNVKSQSDDSSLLMYRRLVENVKSGIYIMDVNGNLTFANYALMDILGIKSRTDILGFNINDRLMDMNYQTKVLLDKIAKAGGGQFKFQGVKEDPIILSVIGSVFFDERGREKGFQGVIQDITLEANFEEVLLVEKKKMDFMLKIFEEIDLIKDTDKLMDFIVKEMANLFRANRCTVMLTSKDGNTLDVVGAFGINDPTILSSKIDIKGTMSGEVALHKKAVLIKNIEYDKQFQQLRKKTSEYDGRSFMIAPLEYNDQVIGVINVSEKKAEIKHTEPFDEVDLRILQHIAIKIAAAIKNVELFNELNLLTHTDPLTQIFNYRLLSESLEREIKRFKREKNPLCVFMMDLDSFKSYNDTFGHLEGDELLKGLGSILKNSLRDTDIACRYAGDEFCAILPNTNMDGVKNAADKVIKAVSEYPFKRKVTISIGAAMYEETMIKKDFLAKADKALYQAKHSGKNQVVILP